MPDNSHRYVEADYGDNTEPIKTYVPKYIKHRAKARAKAMGVSSLAGYARLLIYQDLGIEPKQD